MNEPLKNILNDNDLISNNNLKFLRLLIKQYEAREVELNNTNKDLKQSLSNLEVEIQFLNFDAQKSIKDYVCKETLAKTIDDLFDDLLEKNIDEPMNEYDKLSFNIDHVKHVGEIVTLLRYMISKNDLLLLEVKDMIDFLKKKRVNWTRVC